MIAFHFRNGRRSRLNVLCLGAHADDIEIGCGGTLLKLAAEYGNDLSVHWVVFGATPAREKEARKSARLFLNGTRSREVTIHHFEDAYFPYVGAEIKKCVQELGRQASPDLIFTHHRKDLHQDHRLISELTWNAFRNSLILEYEVPKYDGDLGAPNVFVHLNGTQCNRKIRYLLNNFQTQRDKQWFTRETFLAFLRLRGVESNSPGKYAEAFYGHKCVVL